jgi:hypothetical protein
MQQTKLERHLIKHEHGLPFQQLISKPLNQRRLSSVSSIISTTNSSIQQINHSIESSSEEDSNI